MPGFFINVSKEEAQLIRSFSIRHDINIEDLFKESVLEKIEDELDFQMYNKAMEEYRNHSVSYTFDEVKKELGFD